MQPVPDIDLARLTRRLAALEMPPTNLRAAGDGWWSRCFAFEHDDHPYVVRAGRRDDYFAKDRLAAQWAGLDLPVPQVPVIATFDELFLAVSDRVEGQPLEDVDPSDFVALVPQLATLIAELQRQEPAGSGWGNWDRHGNASFETWSGYLASAFGASPDGFRSATWREGLDDRLASVVDRAEARFAQLDLTGVERAVLHADLLHRNAHVVDGRITGVFDWGAAAYGDPIYESACFEYWQPWHPSVDADGLIQALRERTPSVAANHGDRRDACLIQIGVTHIAFTAAQIDATESAHTVADRLEALVDL